MTKNKQPQAFVLQYDDNQNLPHIKAAAGGAAAEQIIELAAEHGVAIHQSATISDLFKALEKTQDKSEDGLRLASEIVAFLFHIDSKAAEIF